MLLLDETSHRHKQYRDSIRRRRSPQCSGHPIACSDRERQAKVGYPGKAVDICNIAVIRCHPSTKVRDILHGVLRPEARLPQ
ncbi:hypothetical protein LSH36_7g03031 [Paralvinella palmiformis]|uniref:Uncharacterized protein n=1 Tax=Paralvinella palmiformis TaxID=53620 RepID=A0AAD9KDJ4_9ANNE|nr:hypothetical protein LSH36_7g03031 [Paralvinella palmiformis]